MLACSSIPKTAAATDCLARPACAADIAAHGGPSGAERVVVYLQGGPRRAIDRGILEKVPGDILLIVPFQIQGLPEADYASADIDFETAKVDAQGSVNIAARIVRDYVEAGRNVTVVGISYGAFVAQQLLADQSPIADRYIIGVGRIDMPDQMWISFSQGVPLGFDDGQNIVSIEESGMGGVNATEDTNMMRLAAGLAYHRFSENLAEIDLSKITYVYAKADEQVGALNAEEIRFLRDQGADVRAAKGMHADAVKAALAAAAAN